MVVVDGDSFDVSSCEDAKFKFFVSRDSGARKVCFVGVSWFGVL